MKLNPQFGTVSAHGFIGDIQVLRGIAVIMTFFAHVPGVYPQFNSILFFHFWTGVDLFFIISGFVIARSFFPNMLGATSRPEKVKLSIAFWIRRFYRLFPASIFWAVFLLICAWKFNKSGIFATWRDVLNEVVAILLYSKNIASAYGINFSLGPYWSLSLEEQFYFALPLVLIFLPKLLNPVFYMPLALLLTAFSGLISPNYHLFRFEYFLVGIFIYQVRNSEFDAILAPTFLRERIVRDFVVIACLAVMIMSPSFMHYWPGHKLFVMIAAGFLVFFASYGELVFSTRNYLIKFLRWVGDRSYSFYLAHMASLLMVYEVTFRVTGFQLKELSRTHALMAVIAAFLLTLLVSNMSWRALEKTMQGRGRVRANNYLSDQ